MNNLTCLIPLYRSLPFVESIQKNIDSHISKGATVIVSDRHCLDDTVSRLQNRYKGNDNVLFFADRDELNWVENINFLISNVETDYFRILPHDDISSAESSKHLVTSLELHSSAAIATGKIIYCDENFDRLLVRENGLVRESNRITDWSLSDSLQIFGMGRFDGGFKGVVRSSIVRENNLYIKPTPSLKLPERAWLFALSLLGGFIYNPKAVYLKTIHAQSVTYSETLEPKHLLEVSEVMSAYCDELIQDSELRRAAKFNMYNNIYRRVNHMVSGVGPRPSYDGIMPSI